jgi:hypothetical protein
MKHGHRITRHDAQVPQAVRDGRVAGTRNRYFQ